MSQRTAPEQRTVDVNVEQMRTEGNTVHGHAAVFNVLSEDLGGFRERIAPGAFTAVLDADVRLLVNHDPDRILARTKSGTLRMSQDDTGLAFEAELPDTSYARDLRESIQRGDVDGASFRFVVGDEAWDGDVREVRTVKELHDLTIATVPAYPAASVELRTRNNNAAEQRQDKENEMDSEDRKVEGGLAVEDRAASTPASTPAKPRGLADEFRSAGFPGDTATIGWQTFEDRAVTWTGSVDNINKLRTQAGPFGADERYAWPAFPRVAVDPGATSVDVMTQTARSLATAANVIRAIDAVTAKPETGSTLTIVTTALKQVATIQTNIPNVYLEQQAFNTTIENDLRLAINDGLDKLILDAIATSGFQAPGTDPLLVSIRKAMTTIQASGYSPDTLLLRPADAEALDTLRATATAGSKYYVFAPAQLAPRNIFGLNVRISKTVPAATVVDSTALGKLYASPVTLARFEADAGTTNRSNVRMELHAVFGIERTAAAVRIAAA